MSNNDADNGRTDTLTNNDLAFLALTGEYCQAIENAVGFTATELVDTMLRLLPRIYITASDIKPDLLSGEGGYISPVLTESLYDTAQRNIAAVMGEDDTFLEVFVEDMKYSDTPIAATVSESLADLFQVFYDLLETCRDAPNDLILEALASVRESFAEFWSQTLLNVLRALNAIKYL